MPTCDELRTQLADLEAARTRLLTGAAYARVRDASGREVQFANTDAVGIARAIDRLTRQINSQCGESNPIRHVVRFTPW